MNLPFNDTQKMDEIIFANRNKNYGAYAIRSSYNVTLLRALIIIASCVFMFAALAYSFTAKEEAFKHDPGTNIPDSIRVVTFDAKPEEPTPPEMNKKTPPPPSNDDPQATVIKDSTTNQQVALNEDLGKNNKTDSSGTGPEIPGGPGTGTGTPVTFTLAPPTTTYAIVEESPEFDGGTEALRKFLRDNVIYPTLAREVGIEGTVHVSFVVEETGKVGALKVLRGVGGGCTEEAVRVVGKIPPFKKPGKMGGVAVRCWFNIPISFRLR